MIKAVIFDLDNTLVDFMKMKRLSIEAALTAMIDAGLQMDLASASQAIARPPLLFFHWNQDGDFHFSVSAPLMKQNPDVFKDLLLQLHQCCLLQPGRGPSTPASGT